ncbi:competence protein ComK [Alkalicoccus chagannorensis]
MLCPALRPEGGTKVVEMESTLLVDLEPKQIMEAGCLDGGSTLEGRAGAIRWRFRYKQRTPILVRERDALLLFPTHGEAKWENHWINPRLVAAQEPSERRGTSRLRFVNGAVHEVPVSSQTMEHQLYRAHSILSSLFADRPPVT